MFHRIPLAAITDALPVRALHPHGLERLRASIQTRGFLENYPLTVQATGPDTYRVIDGRHRWTIAQTLGIAEVPVIIVSFATDADAYAFAFRSNTANETYVPNTLVTYAEFVWARIADGMTQVQIAELLGWSREHVKDYVALQKISPTAWTIIGATINAHADATSDHVAPMTGATAPFTERLLRDILPLTPEQQHELVQKLADGSIQKGRFTSLAKAYQARNEMAAWVRQALQGVDEDRQTTAIGEVTSGRYDSEWTGAPGAKLQKLVDSLRAEWQNAQSVQLLHGTFAEQVAQLPDGSIDLIVTDPPYNVSTDRVFTFAGRSAISQDMGTWDHQDDDAYLADFADWAATFFRLLRDGGSGYVFCADRYLSHCWRLLEHAGLQVHTSLVWYKTNPGTQVHHTTFRRATEFLLYFTKGTATTFHWLGENEMHNHLTLPVCGGNERLKTAQGETLHPTQKPEALIAHLLEVSSNRGDLVFDGFAGTGTTAAVAKRMGRRCIAIELNATYYAAALWRLGEVA